MRTNNQQPSGALAPEPTTGGGVSPRLTNNHFARFPGHWQLSHTTAHENQQPTTAWPVYQAIGSFPKPQPMKTNNQLTNNHQAL